MREQIDQMLQQLDAHPKDKPLIREAARAIEVHYRVIPRLALLMVKSPRRRHRFATMLSYLHPQPVPGTNPSVLFPGGVVAWLT